MLPQLLTSSPLNCWHCLSSYYQLAPTSWGSRSCSSDRSRSSSRSSAVRGCCPWRRSLWCSSRPHLSVPSRWLTPWHWASSTWSASASSPTEYPLDIFRPKGFHNTLDHRHSHFQGSHKSRVISRISSAGGWWSNRWATRWWWWRPRWPHSARGSHYHVSTLPFSS